jgi:8-oxo-dGTP pyrophosphatase MutT (NUDIX family)
MESENFEERLKALELGEVSQPTGERRAAVAMILRFDRGEPEVVLMKRSERADDRWSGQISLPGGHADPAEDLLDTAVRETREEVGIDLARSGRLLGRLPRIQAKARGRLIPMGITPFVFARHEDVEPTTSVEAEEVFWFPLGRAAAGELSTVYRLRHEGVDLKLPSWRFEARTVWGLTHEMLSALLRAVE